MNKLSPERMKTLIDEISQRDRDEIMIVHKTGAQYLSDRIYEALDKIIHEFYRDSDPATIRWIMNDFSASMGGWILIEDGIAKGIAKIEFASPPITYTISFLKFEIAYHQKFS